MKTVKVTTSSEYDVVISKGLLNETGAYAKRLSNAETALIVTDDRVEPIYAVRVEKSLSDAGIRVFKYVFPNGEKSKNSKTLIEILEFAAENHLTRSDIFIALGGGVVGDLTGLAASLYLRGVGFLALPTTLLAAVDSSVGGKTAIDLAAGKNLAGTFYQPLAVLCDYSALDTLPSDVFGDGCAEVIKYGVLSDKRLFDHLQKHGRDFDTEYVITRSVEIKRDFVAADEFDKGVRQFLNLGHTVGHAVERLSGYTVPHGSAVAIGTATVARAAAKNGICTQQTAEEIVNLLKKFGLPTECEYSADELFGIMLSDKKRSGDFINFIIPKQIGACVSQKMGLEQVRKFTEDGLC